jgi:hypothetical protein
MAVKIGRFAKVVLNIDGLGNHTIAEIGQYTLSGFTVDPIEVTAFGDEAKDFIPGMGDPGTMEISGNYDPNDAEGQTALETACDNGTELGPGTIKFYLDASTYLTPKTGGCIIITKCKAIAMDKSGVGTISFSGKLSAAALEQLND